MPLQLLFLSIDIRNGEQLHDAVLRSQTFQQWKEQNAGRLEEDMTRKEMANLFLDEVHMTHYDIQKVIDGRELWEKDRGDVEDSDPQNENENEERRPLDRMADYSDLSLEELLQRMEEVLKQQKTGNTAVGVTGRHRRNITLWSWWSSKRRYSSRVEVVEEKWPEKSWAMPTSSLLISMQF